MAAPCHHEHSVDIAHVAQQGREASTSSTRALRPSSTSDTDMVCGFQSFAACSSDGGYAQEAGFAKFTPFPDSGHSC